MKKITRIFALLLVLVACASFVTVQGQYVKPISLTLSSTDTMHATAAKDYTKTLTAPYYWSLQVYHTKITGSSDTVLYTLKESVDGSHYTAVVGAPTKKLSATGTYIWTGGASGLPLIWSSPYLELDAAYVATTTATSTNVVKLYLKPIK